MALRLIPAIHRATHRIGLYLAQADGDGVTQGEARILAHLAEHDGSTIAELHEGLGHNRSTLTSILDRLDERGFITRETSAQDRRSFVVRLTRSGRAGATRIHRHLERLEAQALDGVAKKDVAALLALLARLAAVCIVAMAGACASAPRPAPAPATLADSIRTILDRAHRDSIFPGAIAVIGTRDRTCTTVSVGNTDWAPGSAAIDDRTLWDLASLTKLVALTTTVATLVDDGRLSLDDTVRRWVPEWRVAGSEGVTVRDLLTHRSGLPAFKLYFRQAVGRDTVRALVLAEPLEAPPRTKMVYSDIGAIILGILVERVTAQAFDAVVRDRVLAPVGMTETQFNPPPSLRPRIAATENDPWRGRLLIGEVHDENAFALGGVSSHAGLFSTANDMVRFARLWLGDGQLGGRRLLRPETARTFATVVDSTFSSRAIGWDTPTGDNSAGTRMKRPAFGHTGFTGTSVWIDPVHGMFVLLLTNRVDPSRARTGIAAVRIAVADAAATYGCR